ncbi:MAG: fimbrillin family protein [Bacteroidales bacterium]
MKYLHTLSILLVIVISSCNGNDDNKKAPDSESDIIFNASIHELALKGYASNPINQGVKATFYAFKSGTETLAAQGNYLADKSGQMTGINNYIMYLLPGSYDFYGISQNDTTLFQLLTNWQSSELQNGIDYLWAHTASKSITESSTFLAITFDHIAANLVFELESGNHVSINTLDSILIQTPVENIKLNLLDAELPQSGQLSSEFTPMIISGLMGNYYILPVNTTTPLETLFYLKINGETKETAYNLKIHLPEGGYVSGKSYNYKLSITESEIIIKAFTVSDWIVNDFTDKPIYPDN